MSANASDFLKAVWGETRGYAELRSIAPNKRVDAAFFPYPQDFDKLRQYAAAKRGSNIYFGVGVRGEKRGSADCVSSLSSVWVDIDFKRTDESEALKRLGELPTKPSATIQSGGGIHAYWFLREPAAPSDFPRLRAVNRAIVKAVGGDPAACDPARIMRVPGTMNVKYDPPRPCSIISFFPEHLYSLSDFDYLPQPEDPQAAQPREVAEKITEGGRHAAIMSLAGTLARRDITPDEMLPTLHAVNSSRCDPPLPGDEVITIAQSAGTYKGTEPINAAQPSAPSPEKENRDPKSLADVLAIAELAGQVEIIPTCFPGLPDGVGHAAGRVTVIGAFTGSGKTSACVSETAKLSSLGHPVCFATVELSNVEIARKMSGVMQATQHPFIWIHEPTSMGDLARSVKVWANKLDGMERAPVLCLDFIQRLRSDEPSKNREREVAVVAESLSTLARRLGIAVIVAAQLNRASQNESRPSLHHLRESGALEQIADLALLIGSSGENQIFVSIAKNRWGPGVGTEVELSADWARCVFTEISPIVRLQPLAVEIVDYLKAHGNTAQVRDIARNVKIPSSQKHPKSKDIYQAGMVCKLFTIDGNTVKLL